MKAEVGTVIFIINQKSRSICPARVNEQVVTKKIDGETITHNIELPSGKIFQLEALDTPYFLTLEDVRTYLLSQATDLINTSVEEASLVAKSNFDTATDDLLNTSELINTTSSSNQMKMTLPDGQVANVNINVPAEFLDESISD